MTLAEIIAKTRTKIEDMETQLAIQRGILAGIEEAGKSIIETTAARTVGAVPRTRPKRPVDAAPSPKRKSLTGGKQLVPRITEALRRRPAGMTIQEIADAIREDTKAVSNCTFRNRHIFSRPSQGIYALRAMQGRNIASPIGSQKESPAVSGERAADSLSD